MEKKQLIHSHLRDKDIFTSNENYLEKWAGKMASLMLKSKYKEYDIKMAILYFIKIKGYWQHENYYIKPDFLVQNLNEIGGLKNIEFV